jgi:hypothetical protein
MLNRIDGIPFEMIYPFQRRLMRRSGATTRKPECAWIDDIALMVDHGGRQLKLAIKAGFDPVDSNRKWWMR